MQRLRALVGLVAAAVLFSACLTTKKTPGLPPVIVTANDGQAQLTIPPNAIPPGFDLSSVHVRRLSPADLAVAGQAHGPLAVYQFEPDGLVWRAPITFTAVLTGLADTLPSLWLIHGGTAVALPDAQVSRDTAADQTTITAPLTAFSQIVVGDGFFDVTISHPRIVPVGTKFTVTVTIRANGRAGHFLTTLDKDGKAQLADTNPLTVTLPLITYVSFAANEFTVSDGALGGTEPISPGSYGQAPKQQVATLPDLSITIERTFVCAQAGQAKIVYSGRISFVEEAQDYLKPAGAGPDVKLEGLVKQGEPRTVTRTDSFLPWDWVACGAESLTWTPTPTRTPNATDLAARPLGYRNTPTASATASGTPSPTSTTPAAQPPTWTSSPTTSPTLTPTPALRPVVKSFVAAFVQSERATHYTVTAIDPSGHGLKYAWTKVQPPGLACGLFGPTDQAATAWQHADAPDGNCPNEPIHLATITVVISNDAGAVTCEYHGGSANGTVAQCSNSK